MFDFSLSDAEMKQLNGLDQGSKGRSFRFDFLPSDDDVTKLPEFPLIARDEY